jgi:hypothetical protein
MVRTTDSKLADVRDPLSDIDAEVSPTRRSWRDRPGMPLRFGVSRPCVDLQARHRRAALATVLDPSPQAVSSWRHGRREPSGQAVLAISALEIPPHLLWEADIRQPLPFLVDQERFDRTEKRIQKALRRLNAVKPMNLDGTP